MIILYNFDQFCTISLYFTIISENLLSRFHLLSLSLSQDCQDRGTQSSDMETALFSCRYCMLQHLWRAGCCVFPGDETNESYAIITYDYILLLYTLLDFWTLVLEASQLVEYRNIVSCIFRAAGNAAARPIQNDVLMEAMHAWMEIWTLSINCHPGACRSEQHCFSSWLTCSLCHSKLRNASISSCCWHDIQAWQIHPLCQIDISMYVYSYIDINLYCVIHHFAFENLRRSRPCSTTQHLLRACAWDLLLPPLVAQTARAQGLLNLLSSKQCA